MCASIIRDGVGNSRRVFLVVQILFKMREFWQKSQFYWGYFEVAKLYKIAPIICIINHALFHNFPWSILFKCDFLLPAYLKNSLHSLRCVYYLLFYLFVLVQVGVRVNYEIVLYLFVCAPSELCCVNSDAFLRRETCNYDAANGQKRRRERDIYTIPDGRAHTMWLYQSSTLTLFSNWSRTRAHRATLLMPRGALIHYPENHTKLL